MADLYGLPSADDEALKSGDPSIGKQILFGLLSSALGTTISAPRGASVAERLAVQKYGDEQTAAQAKAKREAEAMNDIGVLTNFKAKEAEAAAAPQRYEDTGREDKSVLPVGKTIPDVLGSTLSRYAPVGRELPVEGIAEQKARADLANKSDLDLVSKFNLTEDTANQNRDFSVGFANAPFALSEQSKSTPGIRDAITIGKIFPGQGKENVAALSSAVDRGQGYSNTNELYGLRSAEQKERDRLAEEARNYRAKIASDARLKADADKASIPKEEKPATVSQATDAAFAFRMTRADEDMRKMIAEGFDPATVAGFWYKPNWNNLAKDPVARRYAAAQRNFVTAVLRKESGAAIGVDEAINEEKKYFPVVGDDPETIRFKADMRLQSISGVKAAAGDAAYYKVVQKYEEEKAGRAGTAVTPAKIPAKDPLGLF